MQAEKQEQEVAVRAASDPMTSSGGGSKGRKARSSKRPIVDWSASQSIRLQQDTPQPSPFDHLPPAEEPTREAESHPDLVQPPGPGFQM